jgi:hypothetical protein
VLLGSPFGKGTRRLHLDQKGTSWESNEVMACFELKVIEGTK